MDRGDGYDAIRAAYRAGVAAAVMYAMDRKGGAHGLAPDAERYVDRLKSGERAARLLE